jgi:2-dehydropantoate 2-reductase
MHIEIIGAGSLGMLLAARLCHAGCGVRLVARSESQAQAINREGLAYYRDGLDVNIPVETIFYQGTDIKNTQSDSGPDWIFLAVKQRHIDAALAAWMGDRMGEDTRLLCFQNGIGHVDLLEKFIPRDSIFLAVTTEAARKISCHEVSHTGSGVTRIGLDSESGLEDEANSTAKNNVRAAMRAAGFETVLENNMMGAVWNKLLINAAINPLSAVMRVTNGELAANAGLREIMGSLLEEGRTLALRLGIGLEDRLWESLLDVCTQTSANRSSMLQDVDAGRKTEIDWINGGLLRLAEAESISLPVNRSLYLMVKALEHDGEEMNDVHS